MAKKSSEAVACAEYQTIDESLQFIFQSMTEQNAFSNALDFIKSIDINFLPTKEMVQIIIFDILMESEDITCLAYASDYLITIINAFPPTNTNRTFYAESIRKDDKQGLFSDLWSFFCHIVNSYLYNREIYVMEKNENVPDPIPIKYPNCKFLLEFYVKLFAVDLENLNPKSFSSSLMAQLLWPSGDICLYNRTDVLLKWIDDIYSSSWVNNMGDLLDSLHELLTLMVKCFIQGRHNLLTENDAFCHAASADIVEKINLCCKNAFEKLPNVKLFFTLLPFKYLQAKVSEKIIKKIVKQPLKKTYVLTLKDIVDQCMFPKKLKGKFWKQVAKGKEKNIRKKSIERKQLASDEKLKTTQLHELCKQNEFGDLLQALQLSCNDVNTKDANGCTPLHVACVAGSDKCVKLLIQQTLKGSCVLDVTAANFKGITPLHIAIKKNNTDLAGELLRFGGSELLTVADNKGRYPFNLSSSEEMDRLLQEYKTELGSTEFESTGPQEAPVLKSFKDYSIYLHALNCLLCSYCKIFHLYDYIWKKNVVVQSHSNNICCHYIDQDVCSEDAGLISEMPSLIEKFIQSVCKNVSKLELNVDIELIPLKAFAASLKS